MAERDDAQLTESVLAALRSDTFVRPLTLGMEVVAGDGIVTLTGSIDSAFNRETVEHIVRQVEGVKGVNNYLTLMGAESTMRPDADVQHEIIEQMGRDPTIQPERFHVGVRFGRVALSGVAESEEERESVIAAAQRVPGVQAVEDNMEVRIPMAGRRR